MRASAGLLRWPSRLSPRWPNMRLGPLKFRKPVRSISRIERLS